MNTLNSLSKKFGAKHQRQWMGGPATGWVLVLRGDDLLGEGDKAATGVLDGEFLHAVQGGAQGNRAAANVTACAEQTVNGAALWALTALRGLHLL